MAVKLLVGDRETEGETEARIADRTRATSGRSRAQIGSLDARIFGQRPALAGQGNLAYLEHVGTVTDLKRHPRVLLDHLTRFRLKSGRCGVVEKDPFCHSEHSEESSRC